MVIIRENVRLPDINTGVLVAITKNPPADVCVKVAEGWIEWIFVWIVEQIVVVISEEEVDKDWIIAQEKYQ